VGYLYYKLYFIGVKMNLSNHFLLAMPNQNDDIFDGSLIYITEHTLHNGSIGVIVNKPISHSLKNVFKDVDFATYNTTWNNNNLYLGGPVNNANGFVLHQTESNGNKIFDLTNNSNILTQIANSKTPHNLFVAIGYTSWMPMQLETEILNNDWLVVQASSELIFNTDPVNRYSEALRLLGIHNMGQLNFSIHASA
jgi:putative transcriptional regulator